MSRLLEWLAGGSYNDAHFVLRAPVGTGTTLVVLALALGTIVLTFRGYRRGPASRAVLLGALRSLAVLLALALYFEPALELRQVSPVPNQVAVLVDASSSMSIAEAGAGSPTRAERAAGILRAQAGALAQLGRDHRVDVYAFGERLRPVGLEEAQRGVGSAEEATHVAEALGELRARYAGGDLGGVILVSDGADNGRLTGGGARLGPDAAQAFKQLAVPVHTVAVGRAGLRDVAVVEVLSDDFAFIRTAARLEAVVRVAGYAGEPLRVHLRGGGEARIDKEQVVSADKDGEVRVRFEFTPERVGKFTFEVSVDPMPGETLRTNNVRAFALKVIRDRLRVLHIAGRPSWDERFLRGLLKRDPNVDLVSFFILRTPTDLQIVANSELSLIPFPTHELFAEELRGFDVLIVQNFNLGPYGVVPYLDRIRDFVMRGGGLATVGGELAFSGGGYGGTPIAEVLPVDLEGGAGLEPERFYLEGELRPQLTKAGRVHPVTALRMDPTENEARWATLPLLEGANLVRGLKPSAQALATHPQARAQDGSPLPLFAIAEPGEGRSLSLLTDSLWAWAFSPEPADVRAFERFWQNTIRWLCHDPDFSPLRIEADAAEYGRGADVTLRLRAPAEPRLPVEVVVTRGAERVQVTSVKLGDGGLGQLVFKPPGPGAYRAVARATLSGRRVEDGDVFVVRATSRELDDPHGRPGVLDAISRDTGGRALAEGDSWAGLELRAPRAQRVERRREVELSGGAPILLVALGLVVLEWILRRRLGLV